MASTQQRLVREATAFVAVSGTRPRAVVITGAAGIGKTTFLDRLQVELLAAGRANMIVIDDAEQLAGAALARVRERLERDVRCCVLVAATSLPADVARMIDSLCERRVIEVPPLTDDAARELLAELGVQPWTIRARQLLEAPGRTPRMLIDRSLDELDFAQLPVLDSSFDGSLTTTLGAERLELVHMGEPSEIAAFHERVEAGLDDTANLVFGAAAATAMAEISIRCMDLEAAIQHGERASSIDSAPESVRILGASYASSARALRGEPTAMLSLHALAGRASRAALPLVESLVWHVIGWAAGNLGDVATSRRALIRSIQLCDASGAVVLGLQARLGLADNHLAANEPAIAVDYFDEICAVAVARGLHRFRIDSLAGMSSALLSLGRIDAACSAADEALALVLQSNTTRVDVVFVAVNAARAFAAAGSIDHALAPIESLLTQGADSHGPDFWLALEAVRMLGRAGTDPAAFRRWLARLAEFEPDGHGGALRAAHAEADAWRVAVDGRRAEAARLAERARQLWVAAECHDEIALTDVLVQQAPIEHGPRIQLVGSSAGASSPAPDPAAFEVLTKREREIARYVAGGLTNPEIASELHLSPRTVEHHVASILRKLELPNRRELVRGRV